MFALSSVERLRRFVGQSSSTTNDRLLLQYLGAVSRNIASFCCRDFQLASHTEYFDTSPETLEYFLKGFPVSAITSTYYDSTGMFDGGESELDDSHPGAAARSVVLMTDQPAALRGLRVIYTGGLAAHGTRNTLALTGVTGTFVAAYFVKGSISGASGIIYATTAATPISIDVLAGAFEVGDVLSMQTSEGGTNVAGVSATVSAVAAAALCELYPDLALACESEVKYWVTHKDFLESTQATTTPNFRQTGSVQTKSVIRPETRSLVNSFKAYHL
jgi:hypothetical protein